MYKTTITPMSKTVEKFRQALRQAPLGFNSLDLQSHVSSYIGLHCIESNRPSSFFFNSLNEANELKLQLTVV